MIWCFSIHILYLWLDIYQCCPIGYTWCANENSICSLQGTNIIAYGHDSYRWHYKKKTDTFECNNEDGDPVVGSGKECCYQNNIIYNVPSSVATGMNWSPGMLQCNEVQKGFLATETETHIWQFTIFNELNDVRFDNCGSDAHDLQLYLYNNAGTQIAGCDDCGSCGSVLRLLSDFTYSTLPAGTYWVKILPFDNTAPT
eukprot:47817_1